MENTEQRIKIAVQKSGRLTDHSIDLLERCGLKVTKSKDLEDQLALARMQLDEAMLKLSACEEDATSKVHIICGAFKVSSYADEYSAIMKSSGYEGSIIPGPYNFQLVTASSHESVQSAINAIGPIRDAVIETAWIYIE